MPALLQQLNVELDEVVVRVRRRGGHYLAPQRAGRH